MTEPAPRVPYRMWGGRFDGALDPRVERFGRSLATDIRLLPFDLEATLAHTRMLARTGIIPAAAGARLVFALAAMLTEADQGAVPVDPHAEDVHTLIEAELTRRVGADAGWVHTARSRNDQVATAFRMWVRAHCVAVVRAVAATQEALLQRAEADGAHLLPAYTHLQRAQPVTVAHALLAHVWALARDTERLQRAYAAADVLPLGAGAVAGVSHPVDREYVARALAFDGLSENSIDAVGDRDFAVEFVAALALLMVHLSRWAEDLVLWSSAEFGFVELTDAIATGSSLMPQKRNPDPVELVRGKSARVLGDLTALLALLKGLPSGYLRDLQEDKPPAFEATDLTLAALEATTAVVSQVRFRPDRMAAALVGGFTAATEIADHLVRHAIPFREAHRLAGEAVRYAERCGLGLTDLTPEAWTEALAGVDPGIAAGVAQVVTAEAAVGAKDVRGGTAPGRVRAALDAARGAVWGVRTWVREREAHARRAREALRAGA